MKLFLNCILQKKNAIYYLGSLMFLTSLHKISWPNTRQARKPEE